MPIQLIDKIKQKNAADFKLLDYIDIEGRITGWQNPVKQIFAAVGDIAGLSVGDRFIVRNTSDAWPQFQGQDIYGNTVSKTDNAIYVLGATVDSEAEPVYLVTAPELNMIVLHAGDGALKKYGGVPAAWTNLLSGGGTVTGQVLRFEGQFSVELGVNYNSTSKQLSVGATMQTGDNINVYVNGIKYTYTGADNAFTYAAEQTYVTWIPGNAGFDLEDGDFIEIEIFNVE